MADNVKFQEAAYDKLYALEQIAVYDFHITPDPLTRYLRDRRLIKGMNI